MPLLSEAVIDGMPLWFFKAAALIMGACFGSFANVVIYRLPLKKSIVRPGSACPSCGHELSWFENIPLLSWIFLLGRCRECKKPISIKYPLVELMMAVLSLASLMTALTRLQGIDASSGNLAALWFFPFSLCFLLVCIIFIDLKHWIIPHSLTIAGIVLGIAHAVLISGPIATVTWYESLIGLAAGALPIVAIIEIYFRITGREGMGYGDVMLMGMAGAWFGYLAIPFILLASSVQGLVATVPLLILKKRSTPPWDNESGEKMKPDEEPASARHMAIPFGPFIGLAIFEWLFFGDKVTAYFFQF